MLSEIKSISFCFSTLSATSWLWNSLYSNISIRFSGDNIALSNHNNNNKNNGVFHVIVRETIIPLSMLYKLRASALSSPFTVGVHVLDEAVDHTGRHGQQRRGKMIDPIVTVLYDLLYNAVEPDDSARQRQLRFHFKSVRGQFFDKPARHTVKI